MFRKLPFVNTVHTIESNFYILKKNRGLQKKTKLKDNTTITLHFSAYEHARVLMDICLISFEISHITESSM